MATDHKGIHAAMAAAFAQMPGVRRDCKNPFIGNNYASLDNIVNTIRPVLVEHGLFFMQFAEPVEGDFIGVRTIVGHASGETIDAGLMVLPAKPIAKKNEPQDKPCTAQSYGGAVTYAKRYALAAVFGVVDEDDDDGNAASRPHHSGNGQARREVPKDPNQAKTYFLNELIRVSGISDPNDAKDLAMGVLGKLKIDKDAATVDQWNEAVEAVRGFERTGGSIERWVSE